MLILAFIITLVIFIGVAVVIVIILSKIIEDKTHRYNDIAASLQTALVPVWLGLATIFIFCFNPVNNDQKSSLDTLGTSLAVGGASLLGGALLGFLFGVPRASRTADSSNSLTQGRDATLIDTNLPPNNQQNKRLYIDNTNIEEISDWLTKILVGIGLVQLKTLPSYLSKLEQLLQSAIGNGVFGVAIVIHFSVCGFFLGYLSSRLFLPGAFSRSVENLIEEKALLEDEVKKKALLESELQSEKDSLQKLLDFVSPQLFNQILNDLKFQIDPADLDLLQEIRNRKSYQLGVEFKSDEGWREQLQKLRDMELIRPQQGGSLQVGKHIQLTALGELFLKKQ